MAFLDELKDHAMDLGRADVAKSKQLAEIIKLFLNSASKEDTTERAYVEIGELYYAKRGIAPETVYVILCERTTVTKVSTEENKNCTAGLKTENNVPGANIPHVETDVPPEEPVDGDCGCCDHEVAPEKIFSDDDGPQEQASDPTGPAIRQALFL